VLSQAKGSGRTETNCDARLPYLLGASAQRQEIRTADEAHGIQPQQCPRQRIAQGSEFLRYCIDFLGAYRGIDPRQRDQPVMLCTEFALGG